MSIAKGTAYRISTDTTSHFNSAETLTVISIFGHTVQFILDKGKGHGAMPIEHLHHLIKKNDLHLITNKKELLKGNEEEAKIS
ncbi:hypothetical protein [Bacillus sp. FJAT-45350]|uniref:hypothetical protein n=1 Tax=Bacillus sp. FJAT-45350 TaxID=2011014 RepID=UPI000BB80346|nr:hypothetical protein [Bacillus sp. FJAT-45350]